MQNFNHHNNDFKKVTPFLLKIGPDTIMMPASTPNKFFKKKLINTSPLLNLALPWFLVEKLGERRISVLYRKKCA